MVKKKFWLFPVVIILLLIGFLIVFAGSTALSPSYIHYFDENQSNPPLTILTIIWIVIVKFIFEEQVIFYLCLFLSGIGVFSFTF